MSKVFLVIGEEIDLGGGYELFKVIELVRSIVYVCVSMLEMLMEGRFIFRFCEGV